MQPISSAKAELSPFLFPFLPSFHSVIASHVRYSAKSVYYPTWSDTAKLWNRFFFYLHQVLHRDKLAVTHEGVSLGSSPRNLPFGTAFGHKDTWVLLARCLEQVIHLFWPWILPLWNDDGVTSVLFWHEVQCWGLKLKWGNVCKITLLAYKI